MRFEVAVCLKKLAMALYHK